MTLKLYRVTCRGMTSTIGGNVAHGLELADFGGERCWIGMDLAEKRDFAALALVFKRSAYVVAEDAADAYRRVRAELDKTDLGFTKGREMDKVELLAEEGMYPECGLRLYV